MKKLMLIYVLFISSLHIDPPFLLTRRIKPADQIAYFKLVGHYLGRELSEDESLRVEKAIQVLLGTLKLKEAQENLMFLLHRAGEISNGDLDTFLTTVELFSELVRNFPKESMRSSFKYVVRKTIEASRFDTEALEMNVNALCEVCLFLALTGSDPNQIRELSWLAKLYSKSPQDYALNLLCFLNVYEGILKEDVGMEGTLPNLPLERRPEPLSFLKAYSQIAWNLFKDPNFYRQMLLYFTPALKIFLRRTGLGYKEMAKEIRQFYLNISFKVANSLKDLIGEGITPVQVGEALVVVTYLSSALLNADMKIGFDELHLIVGELIDVGKEIAERVRLGRKVSAFRSILGKHGMQLIIPLLGDLDVDVGKELINISKILKEVSIKRPQLEKGIDEVQEFKDCMKALRGLLRAMDEAGYRDERAEKILDELESFKDAALYAKYPAHKFQWLVHRRKDKIREILGVEWRSGKGK